MVSVGSKLECLVLRYIAIKILDKKPEKLAFIPNYNPLISQGVKLDDPCCIPFKAILIGEFIDDGVFSIKAKFINSALKNERKYLFILQ